MSTAKRKTVPIKLREKIKELELEIFHLKAQLATLISREGGSVEFPSSDLLVGKDITTEVKDNTTKLTIL